MDTIAGFYKNKNSFGESRDTGNISEHGEDTRPGRFSYYPSLRKDVSVIFKTSLTQKLVPLLSKIRTKEPAVMVNNNQRTRRIAEILYLDGYPGCARSYGLESR